MADTKFVINRFRAHKSEPYPEHPFWQAGGKCDGLAFMDMGFRDIPDLTDMRDNIAHIWEGACFDGTEFCIIAFVGSCHLDVNFFTAALPLKQIKVGILSSYGHKQTGIIHPRRSQIQAVDIWWNGQEQYLQASSLRTISLALLWPDADITIHDGLPFKRSGQETTEIESGGEQKITKNGTEIITVTSAETIFDDDEKDVFEATDKTLARMQEMTKLGNIFGRLFGRRLVGKGAGGKNGKGRGDGEEQADIEKIPGFFESMAGWMRWHTPLGSAIAKQFGERMGLVEKLIKKGDIDSALKLALKLGGADGKKKQSRKFPLKLPDMRSNLDFNFGGGGYSMPIMGGSAFENLRNRYTQLAKELEEKGDYRRAAYIRSQLLDEQHEAVLTLERGEMYAQAAKLSLKTGQDPTLTIRLYYKAGEKDKALAFAVRTDCFDRLAEDSRGQDPEYHSYVIKAWTDRLLATNQPLRALEVTDELAKGSDKILPDLQLIELRRDWLWQALEMERTLLATDTDLFRPALISRALLYAKWDGEDISANALQAFPFGQISTDTPFNVALSHFQTIVSGVRDDSDTLTLSILSNLSKEASKAREDQKDFWDGPAQLILDKFCRAVISHSSQKLDIHNMQGLKNLAQMASLPVLALDLGKIKTLNKKAKQQNNACTVPAPTELRTTQILKACLLANGTMLVWYDNDRLELLNQNGTSLWVKQVSQIKDILPLGTSPNVMILQEHTDEYGDGATRLSRFETHKRRFFEIGALHLVAWHDVISDGQWMVQVDNKVGAVDMVQLSRPTPKLEFLWMAETSNDLHIMAFLHNPRAPTWLTRNVTNHRFGVMQAWRLEDGAKMEPQLCLPYQVPHEDFLQPHIDWQWSHYQHGIYHNLGITKSTANLVQLSEQNHVNGKRAIEIAKRRVDLGYAGTDTVQVCDFGRMGASTIDKTAGIFSTNNQHRHKQQFTVQFEGEPDIRILARGTNFSQTIENSLNNISHLCLCTDQFGRLLRVDMDACHVEAF